MTKRNPLRGGLFCCKHLQKKNAGSNIILYNLSFSADKILNFFSVLNYFVLNVL